MRHLQLLPCPESWERMRVDGEGRHCERCSLRVIDTTTLDEEALASLGADPTQRSCGRFELEGGRPRGKHGLAAGVLVLALAGCAAPMEAQTAAPALSWSDLVDETGDEANPDAAGIIAGVVRDQSGTPLEGALVVLMSTALPQSFERMTSARGVYVFRDLPPGNYTIQVLFEKANVSKITALPAGAKFRANFSVDPSASTDILLGALVSNGPLDRTTASSTYSSTLIEIP